MGRVPSNQRANRHQDDNSDFERNMYEKHVLTLGHFYPMLLYTSTPIHTYCRVAHALH